MVSDVSVRWLSLSASTWNLPQCFDTHRIPQNHCLENAARGLGNIVARCLLLCSRADLVFRLAIITVWIAMFCCSFGEAPKYPFTPYIKDSVLLITPFKFSIHFSTKFLLLQGVLNHLLIWVVHVALAVRHLAPGKSSSPQSTIGTSKSSSYSSFMLLKHIISFICSISCTSSCIHVHAHSRTHFT